MADSPNLYWMIVLCWFTKLAIVTWTLKSDPVDERCRDCPLCWWRLRRTFWMTQTLKIFITRGDWITSFSVRDYHFHSPTHTLITFTKSHALKLEIYYCSDGIFNEMPWTDRINNLISPYNHILSPSNQNQISSIAP